MQSAVRTVPWCLVFTELLDAGGYHAPYHELIVFGHADGFVVGIGRDEPGAMVGFVQLELLQGELSIDKGGT